MHPRAALRAALFAAGAAAPLLLPGCGPSFQTMYEGDVQFEHCYALDQGPTVAPDEKKTCWRDWLHGYTTGQSRDRVEYAATRLSQLSLDPTLPSEDNPTQRPRRRVAAPMPTNMFAPPPGVIDGAKPAASASASASARPPEEPVVSHAPGAECAEACSRNWNGCHKECKDKGCDACDKAYRTCVPACFGAEPPRQPPAPARSTR